MEAPSWAPATRPLFGLTKCTRLQTAGHSLTAAVIGRWRVGQALHFVPGGRAAIKIRTHAAHIKGRRAQFTTTDVYLGRFSNRRFPPCRLKESHLISREFSGSTGQSSRRFRPCRCMNSANAIGSKMNRHSTTNRTVLFIGVGEFFGKRAVGSTGEATVVFACQTGDHGVARDSLTVNGKPPLPATVARRENGRVPPVRYCPAH